MGSVTKTDINLNEVKHIKKSPKIHFQKEDATHLSFLDNTFDLVYSISAVEHIYENCLSAIKEMLRVTRLGGIIYLTFPVSEVHVEEWLDFDIYSNQYKTGDKTFFQYRFDQGDFLRMMQGLTTDAKTLAQSIYWERKYGLFDFAVERLRKKYQGAILNLLRNSFLHLYYGFTLLEQKPGNFNNAKSFGNMCIILKKIAG
jgi:ubiquinone/menaquinone biosynthesis C-methylase UbiE